MKNQKNWIKHDILEALKSIFRLVGLIVVIILPAVLFLRESIWIVIVTGVLGSIIYVLVIIPRLYPKIIWKGTENLSDYSLIRVWGKFKLIKVGVFGNYTVIEDLNKDGIPDRKTEKHFMGRFGYFNYLRKLDEIDYEAFTTAFKTISK